ncbi:hypothetical protein, partial [Streptomyces malaysiensis]
RPGTISNRARVGFAHPTPEGSGSLSAASLTRQTNEISDINATERLTKPFSLPNQLQHLFDFIGGWSLPIFSERPKRFRSNHAINPQIAPVNAGAFLSMGNGRGGLPIRLQFNQEQAKLPHLHARHMNGAAGRQSVANVFCK